MGEVELRYCSATDVGRVRDVNEDAAVAEPPVFVVADGMGGHHGGDVASRIVVERFAALAADWRWQEHDARGGRDAVARALADCQREITAWSEAQGSRGRRGYAGTTAVVAVLVTHADEPHWLVANLGDSRAYRLLDGALAQVSVDHSLVQDLVDEGSVRPEDADGHPESHVITRALGGPDEQEADYFLLPMPSLDRLLLCSDGVTDMVADDELADLLRTSEDPRDAVNRVVSAALVAGGDDNATALVVDVVGWSASAPVADADRRPGTLEEKLGAPS